MIRAPYFLKLFNGLTSEINFKQETLHTWMEASHQNRIYLEECPSPSYFQFIINNAQKTISWLLRRSKRSKQQPMCLVNYNGNVANKTFLIVSLVKTFSDQKSLSEICQSHFLLLKSNLKSNHNPRQQIFIIGKLCRGSNMAAGCLLLLLCQ